MKLTKAGSSPTTYDVSKCIICQTSAQGTSGSKNGRKRIREAAEIRNDSVYKRLKLTGEDNFVYHMNNRCYKSYTLQKTLKKILTRKADIPLSEDTGGNVKEDYVHHLRCKSTPRALHSGQSSLSHYKKTCVICGKIKCHGILEKYRISEKDRAAKFLEATVFLQDDVYRRTCDLQDINSVFGADLVCHKRCINRYLLEYERICLNQSGDPVSSKKQAWLEVVREIEMRLSDGEGLELSYVRKLMNEKISSSSITNQEVKVLLSHHFGEKIRFSTPKQVNKSLLFFSADVTQESLAETIRCTDPVRECAEVLRQSLMSVNFDLTDRFCDANDLKEAWNATVIPEPLLRFFGHLLNFDTQSFQACKINMDKNQESELEDEGTIDGPTASPTKVRQIQSLFQIMYYVLHGGRKRTPLHIMNAQAIYDICKSATLITNFNRFGLCTSYDELARFHNDMAMFIVASDEEQLIPFPSHFDTSVFTTAAIDNFDHNEATLSGMGGTHDTVTVVFQDDSTSHQRKPKVSEAGVDHGPKSFKANLKCQQLKEFYKPSKRPELPECYKVPLTHSERSALLYDVRTIDTAWLLGRLDFGNLDSHHVSTKPKCQEMPTWSAANSILSSETLLCKRVGFLPVLPHPVTRYDVVYTAMKNLQGFLEHLNQSALPVTCDEGVYHIARHIQLLRPGEFKNIVLCLGSFHMTKVALGCLGKYLKGSGAETILTESSVFGPNVVDSVMSAKCYVRSLKGMQLLKEALRRLQWAEFFKEEENLHKYIEQLKIVQNLKSEIRKKSSLLSVTALQQFKGTSDNLLGAFDQFIQVCKTQSETFQYWDTFLSLMSNVENLIRSDREGNWALHLQAVEDLLPLFAAFDSTNYLRWCSLYLEDMHQLPQTNPVIYEAFSDGKFVVKRTPGKFKAVGADMALEQTINKSQKSASGIIGRTKQKQYVARWELIYHEMLAVTNLYRELSGANMTSYDLDVNRAFNTPTTENDERNIQSILIVIERTENPFSVPTPEPKLHNILTREIMTEDIRKQMLNVQTIGEAAYNKFRKERFLEKTVRFGEPIHRINLKTFQSLCNKSKTLKYRPKSSDDHEGQMQRLLEVSKTRGRKMEDLVAYDLSSTSPLFYADGLMTQARKSTMVVELEKNLTKEDSRTPSPESVQTGYILDVMAALRRIGAKQHANFGQFTDALLKYTKMSAKYAQRIDFVFDSYQEKSIKDSERRRREKTAPIELHDIKRETPVPADMDRFWSSKNNKLKLQSLIHEEALRQAHDLFPNVEITVSQFSGSEIAKSCYSSMTGLISENRELNTNLEEADVKTIPHASHLVKKGLKSIIVLSQDTDVLILMLHYWDQMQPYGLCELWVKAGVGGSSRFIPVHTLAMRLGGDLCKVLPAVHALTGCDYTSKVGTKLSALNAKPEIYLQQFGKLTDDIEAQISVAEDYLCQVLKKGTPYKTMDKLRNFHYHQSKRGRLDELPPTSHALREHIMRSFYTTYQMTSLMAPCPILLNPLSYGYEEVEEELKPNVGLNPIPEEFAIHCTCTRCASARCRCRKNGLPCCKFCKCQSGLKDGNICRNPSGTQS